MSYRAALGGGGGDSTLEDELDLWGTTVRSWFYLVFFPFLQVRLLEGPLAYSKLASKSLKLDCSQKSPLKPKQNCWRFKERERERETVDVLLS
jgi:hypothetical protein